MITKLIMMKERNKGHWDACNDSDDSDHLRILPEDFCWQVLVVLRVLVQLSFKIILSST